MRTSEFSYWSSTHGADITRISMADDNGAEFYAIVPMSEGRAMRLLHKKAREALMEAMELGLSPGEIRWK